MGTRLADINGDGLTDVIQSFLPTNSWYGGAPQRRVYLNNGSQFVRSASYSNSLSDTYFSGGGTDMGTRLADINGDGITDVVQSFLPTNGWYGGTAQRRAFSNSSRSLLITRINDGLKAATNIGYEPMTKASVYVKDVSTSYPLIDVQAPIQVVNNVSTSNGIDGQNSTTYKYGGMKANLRGRGNLGFRWMESTDQQTGIKSYIEYTQRYPAIGIPKLSKQTLGSVNLSYTRNLINNVFKSNSGMALPSIYQSTTTRRDLNGALLNTVVTDTVLDEFGNEASKTVTTTHTNGDHFKVFVDNQYDKKYSPASWFEIGQLTSTASRSEVAFGSDVSESINKAFTYNVNGLLETETLEPGTANELKKTYSYDGFGNTISVTTSGNNIATRTSTTKYDFNGQFPELITNALGHTEARVYDARFGKLASRTDSNGLTTIYEYDDFGRKTATVTPRGNRNEITREWCDVSLGHTCTIPAINNSYSLQTVSQKVSYIITSLTKGSNLFEFVPPVKTYFDKFDREVRRESVGFDGTVIYVDTNYDALGRVVARTSPYFSTDVFDQKPDGFVYDLLGRVTSQYSSTGTRNDVIYNGLFITSNSLIQNPARTETKVETRDALGQLVSVQDNALQTINFAYNPLGKRTTTTDPLGNVIELTYDKFGRKKSMKDPDMGEWFYTYNVLGELVSQIDAKAQTTSMSYDVLGRLIRRIDNGGLVSTWSYNDDLTNGGTSNRNKAIGKLDTVISSNGYTKNLYYDNYGAVDYSTVQVGVTSVGTPARTDTSYDEYGRIDIITYPESIGRFQVKHNYINGFLDKVTSPDNTITYWQADLRRASGQVQHESYGNNLKIMRDFDSGERVSWLNIGDADTLYQAYYTYDSIGNITNRKSTRNQGSTTEFDESYTYDNLNRLTNVDMAGLGAISRSYDELGNIVSKGNNAYTYYAGRPHAVKTAFGTTYTYDLNGNMLNGDGKSIVWSSYNKPINIRAGGSLSLFRYGPSRQRFYQYQYNNSTGNTKITHYFSPIFEKTITGGVAEYKNYIRVGGKAVAVHTRKANAVDSTEYLLRDYQGSVVAVTDEKGNVKGHMDYDAFGGRRPILGLTQLDSIIESFPRGYTGHEHLDLLGLIHMNGRVYDPKLGRFLSADPFIQFSNNLQSYNRFSYVLNNPMSYTDPSGFFVHKKAFKRSKLLKIASTAFAILNPGTAFAGGLATQNAYKIMYSKQVTNAFLNNKGLRVGGQIVAGVLDGWFCSGACSAGYAAYLTDISGGSGRDVLKAAALSYASYAAFSAANSLDWGYTRVAANGLVGGTASELGGGTFADGFRMAGGFALVAWGQSYATKVTNDFKALSCREYPGSCSNGNKDTFGFRIKGEPTGMFDEGSPRSWARIPVAGEYLQSVSKVHDYLNSNVSKLFGFEGYNLYDGIPLDTGFLSSAYSIAGMPFAGAYTGAALLQPYTSSVITAQNQERF